MSRPKQRPRAADKLTRTDVRIAVCSACGRYGGISTENGRCAPGDSGDLTRVKACHRMTEARR